YRGPRPPVEVDLAHGEIDQLGRTLPRHLPVLDQRLELGVAHADGAEQLVLDGDIARVERRIPPALRRETPEGVVERRFRHVPEPVRVVTEDVVEGPQVDV